MYTKRNVRYLLTLSGLAAEGSSILAENQMRENLRKWLSPSDPSTNHNVACAAHLEGTASWFLRSGIFRKWRSTGSILWINGMRTFLNFY